MPRMSRIAIGDYVYHVLNRATGRKTIFETPADYKEFEQLLVDAKEQFDMRILAYAIMPNHWHLLLYPRGDHDMATFMRWLSTTHARHFRIKTESVGDGHLYQGRYKSFIIDTDAHLLTVLKYIERNPARAKLVKLPEEWKWGSAHRRIHGTKKEKALLDPSPVSLPYRYREWINSPEHTEDIKSVRFSVNRAVPFGGVDFRTRFLRGK